MLGLHELRGVDPWAVVVHFSTVSLCFCVASLFLFERSLPVENVLAGRPLLLMLGLGTTATAGQVFLTKAFAAGPPAKVSVVGLTQVVFAILLDWLLWERTFSRETLIGTVLVVTPTAWLMLYRKW